LAPAGDSAASNYWRKAAAASRADLSEIPPRGLDFPPQFIGKQPGCGSRAGSISLVQKQPGKRV